MLWDFLTYDVPLASLILLAACIFMVHRFAPRPIYKCDQCGNEFER